MRIKKLPTSDVLHECFYYENGKLYWREDRPEYHFNNKSQYKRYLKISPNKEVGTKLSSGYLTVSFTIQGFKYSLLVHRVIYKMFKGCCDDFVIDHVNHDPSDNRIENLRKVTFSQNLSNMQMKKKSGLMGAYLDKSNSKWKAQIKIHGKIKHIGWFKTEQEAHDAYMAVKTEYHKTF